MNIDLKQLGADIASQFEGLQGRHPGLWPLAPRLLCAAGVPGDTGATAQLGALKHGDVLQLEATTADGSPLFGLLDQGITEPL